VKKRLEKRHPYFFFLHPTTIDMPNPGSGSPKEDDSLRSRNSSNSLTDQLVSTLVYQPLHPRGLPVRSLLPRRTPQEQREFLASVIREAMSIVDDEFGEGEDDDSANDDGKGGVSNNSSNYGDSKQ
jgi:hypothetical protein